MELLRSLPLPQLRGAKSLMISPSRQRSASSFSSFQAFHDASEIFILISHLNTTAQSFIRPVHITAIQFLCTISSRRLMFSIISNEWCASRCYFNIKGKRELWASISERYNELTFHIKSSLYFSHDILLYYRHFICHAWKRYYFTWQWYLL